MTKRMLSTLLLCAALAPVAPATAGNPVNLDHLHCYSVKDTATKVKYTATFGILPCTFTVPAKVYCRPAVKSNVSPPPPLVVPGPNIPEEIACYKAKCAKLPGTESVMDQFGSRTVTLKGAKMICAPKPIIWVE